MWMGKKEEMKRVHLLHFKLSIELSVIAKKNWNVWAKL